MQIYRNNQMLGIAVLPGNKISNARANPESLHKILLTHCVLEYNPISRNDNPQDLIIGIQECKTQFNGSDIPKNLLNLLAFMRDKKANEIWQYFEEFTELVEPIPPVITDSESESDSKSETAEEANEDKKSEIEEETNEDKKSETAEEAESDSKSETVEEAKEKSKEGPKDKQQPKIKGIHILSEITRFTDNLDSNMNYEDSLYFELYDLLQRINQSD